MARYESHDDETLSMMDDYLKEFYITVEVFKQFQSWKVAEKQVAAESLHQVTEAELEAAEMSDFTCHETFLKERLEIIHQQQLDFTDELISFNFPKMHLMQHYVDHVK